MSSIVRWASLAVAESQLALTVVSCGNSSSAETDGRTTGSGGASQMVSLDEDHLASQLLKSRVENEDGIELGRVKDLALDTQMGRVAYVIIASGGTFGLGKQLRAVPVEQVSTATTKINTLAVNLDGAGWRNSPLLSRRDLAAQLSDRSQRRQARTNLPRKSQAHAPLPTGRELETPYATTANNHSRLQLASQVLDRRITNRADEKIGKLTDLLVDLSSARPSYAIVSSPAFLARPDIFAIPLDLLHPENGRLTIDAGRNVFETAPPFDDKAWTRQPTTPLRIYRVENEPAAQSG